RSTVAIGNGRPRSRSGRAVGLDLRRIDVLEGRKAVPEFPRKSDGRRAFTVEFKRGVVRQLLKGEKTLARAVLRLDMQPSVVQQWKRRFDAGARVGHSEVHGRNADPARHIVGLATDNVRTKAAG